MMVLLTGLFISSFSFVIYLLYLIVFDSLQVRHRMSSSDMRIATSDFGGNIILDGSWRWSTWWLFKDITLKTRSFAKLLQLLITRISSSVDPIMSHICSCFYWSFLCFRLVVWFIIKLLQLSKVVLIANSMCLTRGSILLSYGYQSSNGWSRVLLSPAYC